VRLKLPRTKKRIARLLARCADVAPEVNLTADDPAYIAFTSGSTGQPKGVLCRHGPISHFFPWQTETFELKSFDRYGLLSGLGYNHLHRDIFTALALGATLRVPSEDDLKDPDRLAAWLRWHEISILHLTPALGRFLQSAERKILPSVRRVFFGGDLLSSQDVAAMRKMAPGAAVTSFYGATETQRAVGYFIVPDSLPGSHDRAGVMPIGRGAPGVQLLLLTPNHQLAGIGETGELYVRSPHLAAGYVGDQDLTEAHFVTNPFSGERRDRLYRTRELGRYLPDGHVEWLGRNNRRASVRGFRVELAEVEAILGQYPGVRHTAVVAQEYISDGSSNRETRLIAYVECEKGCALDAGAAREFLNGRLPYYMVPSHFNLVERMPLNPNGKIAYAALQQAEPFRSQTSQTIEAPANDLEQAVAAIFADVLQLERIGRRENFFALGGHSLIAAKAAARIREALGLGLDLRTFLECPTVEGICRRIEADPNAGAMRDSAPCEEREEIEL
jgi:amino acid adenylation domain-containing protein